MTRRRIVVGLGAGTRQREVAAAAAFAERLGAELLGLFVEDTDLLRFAALPFAQQIGFASAARLKLDVGAMERAMRGLADEAERMLASTAQLSAIPWTFRVVRGAAAQELLSAVVGTLAAGSNDEVRLLLLGDGESPARQWAEQAGSVLAGREPEPRVRIVQAMDLAALDRALREDGAGVLVLSGDPAVLARQELHAMLRESAAPVLLLPARSPRHRDWLS
jgi:hypothetical protein